MTPHSTKSKKNIVRRWSHWFEEHQRPLGRCAYCGVQMTYSCDNPSLPTTESRDHTLPASRGGLRTIRVCLACNQDKHALTVNEYRAVLMIRRRRIVVFWYEKQYPSTLIGYLARTLFPRYCSLCTNI